ncbi:hypothetical protein PNEG_02382 [Pneumocystis murina B123]|uniref:Uncharacterized protein n=1 Tax=Pneumocystis murina (strain B123) TaxID=1069680 RepID=M7P6E3_PNEMU|nr:hypothetical protein PNEG_02382 [Pneumocystis murina B123]EMR09440.1 hypothetical protein PNEG_02382 [Pneumocystis murina B123]
MEKNMIKQVTLKKERVSISSSKMIQVPLHAKDSENSQKFKKYSGGLDKILQSFDGFEEWADYISFLSKLLKTLQAYPTFAVVPYQDLVACRLSQCLNPNLPSGVHQKTLEVYSYIFSLIGKKGLSESLSLWSSGLAHVMTFASTKIKPHFLELIERFYLPLGSDLRPCTKSLIISLLPGLEEESGEYFNETFNVLDSIRQKLDDESFFWQCFWLCIITSPQQRQGALKYLSKRLPVLKGSSNDIFPIIHPDSGLFIRAFSAGLNDEQLLICRGFLELLVQNVPLSSDIFQKNILPSDIELLIISAIKVVLGKELSLNRRVWSWLMGSDLEQNMDERSYFRNYAMDHMINSIKKYLTQYENNPVKLGEMFRILLSFMDRPSIGNIVVSEVFLPSIRTIYIYSSFDNDSLYNNVLSSARTFFDSIDSKLIWSKILSLVDKRGVCDFLDYKFALYIISNFNIHEEDMIFFHISLVLFIIISNIPDMSENITVEKTLFLITHKLLFHIPNNNSVSNVLLDEYNVQDRVALRDNIIEYYKDYSSAHNSTKLSREIVMDSIFYQLIDNIEHCLNNNFYLFEVLLLIYEFIPKASQCSKTQKKRILDVIEFVVGLKELNFDHIYFIVKIIIVLLQRTWINVEDINTDNLLIPLVFYIWDCFSPGNSKHHIDASRLLWALHRTLDGSYIETIIVYAMNIRESSYTSCLKFTVLWKYSVDESLFVHVLGRPSLIMIGFLHSDDIHTKLLVKSWIKTLDFSFIRLLDIIITKLLSLEIICSPKDQVIEELEISLFLFRETDDVLMLSYYISVCVEIIESGGIDFLDHAFTELLNVDIDRSKLLFKYCFTFPDMSYISILVRIAIRALYMIPDSDFLNSKSIVIKLHFFASKLLFYIVSKSNLFDEELIEVFLKRLIIKDFLFESILDKYVLDVLYIILKRNINQYEISFKELFLNNARLLSMEEKSIDHPEKSSVCNILFMLVKFFVTRLSATNIPSNVEILIDFYKNCLGLFTSDIFQIFMPFVETLSGRINSSIVDLEVGFSESKMGSLSSYEIILHCFDALQCTISWALENHDYKFKNFVSKSSENVGFFGNVMSGVFSVEAPNSVDFFTDILNSILLCFQDVVKLTFYVWSWLEGNTVVVDLGKQETYKFINMRLKTASRQLLYVLYDTRPIETLESLISSVNKGDIKAEECIFSFLSKFDDSRKHEIIPFLINSINSRINPLSVTGKCKSSLVISLTPNSIVSFLTNFVKFSQTTFLKQNWPICLAFLRDVVNIPQQYQIINTCILHFSTILIRKLSEMDLDNEKRTRKEMADIYLRILNFAVLKTSRPCDSTLFLNKNIDNQLLLDDYNDIEEKESKVPNSANKSGRNNKSVTSPTFPSNELGSILFRYVIPSLFKIIMDNEKILQACNMIMTNIIGFENRNSQSPRKYSEDSLVLLAKLSEVPGSYKSWRKEVLDAFNDNSFFYISLNEALLWKPIIKQLYGNNKERLFEMLIRFPFYSATSIFVFRDSEIFARKYQLKRLIFVLISSGKDKYADKIKDIENVVLENIRGELRRVLRKEVFLLIRTLIVSMSSIHLTSLWAIILSELQYSFDDLLERDLPWNRELLDLLLDTCKLLDVILVIEPEDFLAYKWIFITDTIDAVHFYDKWKPVALVDKLFHKIFTFLQKSSSTVELSETFIDTRNHNKRSPLLVFQTINDVSDIKPFLTRISTNNYDSMYDMCFPDIEACETGILNDLF